MSEIVYSGSVEVKTVTLTLDTNAYADGDVLAEPVEVPQVFDEPGQAKVLHSVVLLDEDDQAKALDLVFFDASASLGTVNAAVSISDTDARKIIGIVNIGAADYFDLVNSQVAVKTSLGLVMKGEAFYVGAVSRGTGTYTASGIKLKLGFV